MRKRAVVIMAAGLGTRMRSDTVKVLHPVAGRPLIHYPVRLGLALEAEKVVLVLGHQRERVQAYVEQAFPGAPIEVAVQAEQLGTAHAVLCAADALADFDGDVFILSGDVPTLTLETLQALDSAAGDAAVGVLGMRPDDPAAYGRLVFDGDALQAIVEARDCAPEQLGIREVNAGIYRVDARFLFRTLRTLGTDNAQGEYYLTDVVAAAARGPGARALVLDGAAAEDALGVNDRIDLAAAEARAQQRLRQAAMRAGVTFLAPERVVLHDDVVIGPDTVIEPDVSLLHGTSIGARCTVEQGVRLTDTQVGDDVTLYAYSLTESAQIGPHCKVGPFARLRPGTRLAAKVKIGNFVETKNTVMAEGAKASHLSYLGDAEVGPGANIGAGTITCNYDGKNKHRTHIGAGAFIGSDTQLVAPVTVGDGAFVGAGTTVTGKVPPGALALSRVRQKNIEGWVARKKAAEASEEES